MTNNLKSSIEDKDDIITQLSSHMEKGTKTRAGKSRTRQQSGGVLSDEDIVDLKRKVNLISRCLLSRSCSIRYSRFCLSRKLEESFDI